MATIQGYDIAGELTLDDLPQEGLDLYCPDVSPILAGSGLPEPLRPVAGELHLVRKGESVRVRGRVTGSLALPCDRCLELYLLDVGHPFTYLLLPLEGQRFKPEMELTPEEVETSYYEEGIIPVRSIFREQILLQIPMKGLCSPGCRGLCPGCGANLNREPCSCAQEAPEGPFAVLKELLG